jgi:hypothetical protein
VPTQPPKATESVTFGCQQLSIRIVTQWSNRSTIIVARAPRPTLPFLSSRAFGSGALIAAPRSLPLPPQARILIEGIFGVRSFPRHAWEGLYREGMGQGQGQASARPCLDTRRRSTRPGPAAPPATGSSSRPDDLAQLSNGRPPARAPRQQSSRVSPSGAIIRYQ